MRRDIECEICNKNIELDHYDTDGEHNFHEICWTNYQNETAISCGIPKSVVDGKTNLTDHFTKEYINNKCNKKEES